MPPVSVVIAAYNAGGHIQQAIRSVLAQDYSPCEIIVVDDGSTDGTRAKVAELDGNIRYVYQANRGPSAARNAGILQARGESICFLDSDDLWHEGKLSAQAKFMANHPGISLVFTDERELCGSRVVCPSLLGKSVFCTQISSEVPLKDAFRRLLIENFVPTSSVMARRSCLDQAGLFDESLRVSEDRDLWARIAARGSIACLPSVMADKRVHGENISRNTELTLRCRLRSWEKAARDFAPLCGRGVVAALCADAQLQLGYRLLNARSLGEARIQCRASIRNAFRKLGSRSDLDPVLPRYSWSYALALLVLSSGSGISALADRLRQRGPGVASQCVAGPQSRQGS